VRRVKTVAAWVTTAGTVAGALLVGMPPRHAAAESLPAGQATVAEGARAAVAVAVATAGWTPCDDDELAKAQAVCGTIEVPLDHGHPDAGKITLALSMVRHTSADDEYQGVMLVNPGGPGGSGRSLSVLGASVPHGAASSYDWIGFDPRGVGSSSPSLACVPDHFSGPRQEYTPSTPTAERAWLGRVRSYATACGRKGGRLLSAMRTEDVARDLDAIRAALGVPQINYYGFSYGTYLAQVYATLFPRRVRRMVLDSNVDPGRVFYRSVLDQDLAFQRNVGLWWGWVARNHSTYHLGATRPAVERAWFAERDRLRAAAAGGVVGPSEWTDIFLAAGYSQSSWSELAQLWMDWATDRDPKPLVTRYRDSASPSDDNGYAVYSAVQCTDAAGPRDWTRWKRDSTALHKKAPFVTWSNTWLNAPCLFWPVKPGPTVTVDGEGVAPVLLIGETLDAATPFSGSLEVRRRFPQARLISLPGGTNHAFSLSGNGCLDDSVAAYLADGTLPERRRGSTADATCAPLAPPEPRPDARPTRAGGSPAALRRTLGVLRLPG
jgi:pimeloyl-ACP methyl ester carboxylesterase